jgi:hypothetical protein
MIETVESTQQTGWSQEASIAHPWFVGIAWGDQNHQVVLLDQQRRRVGARVVPHDGTSRAPVASWLRAVSGGAPSQVAVALAGPRGALGET